VSGLRVVLQVAGRSGAQAPLTAAARDQYCEYVRSAIDRHSQIKDVVIWNEPNKTHFWRPQFNSDGSSAAPAAYELLLARCYDVLHQFRSDVNVIGLSTAPRGNDDPKAKSNVSLSPGAFIRKVGAAYRASGRTAPVFDTVSHHPYGETSAERPWTVHRLSTAISEGDWAQLMQALWDGFNGTGQPLPGHCTGGRCVSIWYLEDGFQTAPDVQKGAIYSGHENEVYPLPDFGGGERSTPTPDVDSPAPDQATQIIDAVRLASCQPYVQAFFNFLLVDDADLAGWQSAPYWADQTPKDSAEAFRKAFTQASAGATDCARLKGAHPPAAFTPQTTVQVLKLAWPAQRKVDPRNNLWRFRVMSAEDVSYRAVVYRVGGSPARVPVLTVGGTVRRGYLGLVSFPRRRLPPGLYQIEVNLASSANPARRAVRTSPTFKVRGKVPKRRKQAPRLKVASFVPKVMLSEIPAIPALDAAALKSLKGAQVAAPDRPRGPHAAAASVHVVDVDSLAHGIFAEVNRVRRAHGLRALTRGSALARAASGHARFLAASGNFTHDWRVGTPFGRWILRFYPVAGAQSWGAGENLLWWPGSVTPRGAVQRWLASPPHRRVMLTPGWRQLGLGVVRAESAPGVYGGQTVVVVAAEFGVRRG
jgi:uncharacterized protein YkwD